MKIKGIRYDNQTFRDRRVELDGRSFLRCKFIGCVLAYKGGEKPLFTNCTFEDFDLALEDAAFTTFEFLKDLIAPDSPVRKSMLQSMPELGAVDKISDDPNAFFRIGKR